MIKPFSASKMWKVIGNPAILQSKNDSLSAFEGFQRVSYRFTAKEWDEDTKLYYMSARYQNPMTSRWISADPAGAVLVNPMQRDSQGRLMAKASYSVIESLNWYSYVGNNPLKFTDPTGLEMVQTDNLHQQDAPDSLNLGTSNSTIDSVGCVLTAYTKGANAIRADKGLDPVSLEIANQTAIDLGLFTDDNLLTPESGARLMSALSDSIVSFEGSTKGASNIANELFKIESSKDLFVVTGRMTVQPDQGVYGPKRKPYGHHLNINESTSFPQVMAGNGFNVNDTSSRGRTGADLLRIDSFSVREIPRGLQR